MAHDLSHERVPHKIHGWAPGVNVRVFLEVSEGPRRAQGDAPLTTALEVAVADARGEADVAALPANTALLAHGQGVHGSPRWVATAAQPAYQVRPDYTVGGRSITEPQPTGWPHA